MAMGITYVEAYKYLGQSVILEIRGEPPFYFKVMGAGISYIEGYDDEMAFKRFDLTEVIHIRKGVDYWTLRKL